MFFDYICYIFRFVNYEPKPNTHNFETANWLLNSNCNSTQQIKRKNTIHKTELYTQSC